MRRRAALLVALAAAAARPASAMAPCELRTRPAVLAAMRFGLKLPNGDEITEDQWTRFRSDILDPVLRVAVTQRDERPAAGAAQRIRVATIEVPVSFNPGSPPPLPDTVQAVMRAWSERFPGATVEGAMLPVCRAL